MKKIFLLIIAALFLNACKTSQGQLEKKSDSKVQWRCTYEGTYRDTSANKNKKISKIFVGTHPTNKKKASKKAHKKCIKFFAKKKVAKSRCTFKKCEEKSGKKDESNNE